MSKMAALKPSLTALLEGIIDYAGIFPPAELELDEAIRNYDRYRFADASWMLARFICPARRLEALESAGMELFSKNAPFAFSALGRGGESAGAFLAGLALDLEAIRAFREAHGRRVVVDVMEARLPDALVDGEPEALRAFFGQVDEAVRSDGPPSMTVFYEVPLGAAWSGSVERVAAALAADHRAIGLKLRTGGLDAAAFPAPEQVARVIQACRRAGVPFKATAGLHHPFRHYRESVQTRMHGFVNVFGAAALAAAHDLSDEVVTAIVADENPAHFVFEEEALRWQGLNAPVDKIREVRRTLAISYGSCSFDEPREDLKGLGLLS
jgi:hypothetical protein